MADQSRGAVDRRTFLKAAAAVPLGIATIQTDGAWRTFEVVLSVDVVGADGLTRVWLPLPSSTSFQRVVSLDWTAGAAVEHAGVQMLSASWGATAPAKTVTLTMRVSTRHHTWAAVVQPGERGIRLSAADYQRYVKPTRWIPTDGVVRKTALRIVTGVSDPLSRARASMNGSSRTRFAIPRSRDAAQAISAGCSNQGHSAASAPT